MMLVSDKIFFIILYKPTVFIITIEIRGATSEKHIRWIPYILLLSEGKLR